jgi:hypothetical protein
LSLQDATGTQISWKKAKKNKYNSLLTVKAGGEMKDGRQILFTLTRDSGC